MQPLRSSEDEPGKDSVAGDLPWSPMQLDARLPAGRLPGEAAADTGSNGQS
jgi:hypothetical protein